MKDAGLIVEKSARGKPGEQIKAVVSDLRNRYPQVESLKARGVSTPRGGRWHAMSVRNVLARA